MSHICFVTGLYSRYDPIIYYRQARGLVSMGHEVTIIVCDNLPDEEREGIRIRSTHYCPRNRWQRFLHTKKYILQLADSVSADLFQVQDPEHISMVEYFQKKGKLTIFNMRENYPVTIAKKSYIPKMFRRLVQNSYERMIKRYFPKYTAVMTVTPRIVDYLEKKYHLNNVYLVPNYPIPNKDYCLTREEYLQRDNVLFYEGTVYEASRQENILEALQKVPKVKYLVAGKIDAGATYILSHPKWAEVDFVNGFKMDELPVLFSRATISNTLRDFSGLDGSLGVIKIFESMEFALPVIFSDVPIYRKIVEKYKCGVLADPNDIESIRNAIAYLVDNKEEAYEMGQNGRRAVLEEFNYWKQMEAYNMFLTGCGKRS